MNDGERLKHQTIRDFGEQWTHYRENAGYYSSLELLQDHFGPLLQVEELAGQRVGDIGSGTGRIVRMLLESGAGQVYAFEPSAAFEVLRENVRDFSERVVCVRAAGDEIPAGLGLDFLCSIGVIHHIPDPLPVLRAALGALRPGGRFFMWVYGYEGNEAYLRMVGPLRRVTTRMPHWMLVLVGHALNVLLDAYMLLAKVFPLPLRGYLANVIGRFSRANRFLVIYDQLNPAYAKYYRGSEALELLAQAGFDDVQLYRRHGYSWSVLGHKPRA